MIKIPKRQSYKEKGLFFLLEKFFFNRIMLYAILLFFLYIFIPLRIAESAGIVFFKLLFFFYLPNTLIAAYFIRKYSDKKNSLKLESDALQEKLNICSDENSKELKNKFALQEKISRYNKLKESIEQINHSFELDSIADTLTEVSFSLITNNKGSCILSLLDNRSYKLTLFKAKKENEDLIIKAKEGDLFDFWVLRHASSLIVEDTSKDFRFDPEKLKAQATRPVSSLIISPLTSGYKFLGLLRLDSPAANFYTQDDLRFLATICDFGGVALENGELFKRAQELAIHDGLTLLYTKGYFLERLKEECKRAMRTDNPFSLLMLDIDHFKDYNDKFGHTAGDIVLKELSHNITEFLKGFNPIVGRFGGEEFCVILPGMNKKDSLVVAERLRLNIEKMKIILRKHETGITVSIGLSSLPDDSCSEDELVSNSDRAMYQAKQKGRNRVCGI